MRISTRTRYGIRAIVRLAEHYDKGPLRTKAIAKDEQLSVKYLEQLLGILKSAGLVRSVRGSKGGYVLAKAPAKIKLSDCFAALEGPVATVECVRDADYCKRSADCVTRELWSEVERAIIDVLSAKSLQDLVAKADDSKKLIYEI